MITRLSSCSSLADVPGLPSQMAGQLPDVVAKVFKALTGKKVFVPGMNSTPGVLKRKLIEREPTGLF